MTEERKLELARLLEEAMGSLVIRFGYGGFLSLPVDVYRKYLRERWKNYGADFLSFAFLLRLEPNIESETSESNLHNFIRDELAQYVDDDSMKDTVPTANYVIESCRKGKPKLYGRGFQRLNLSLVIERLLQITIVRGAEEAVAVFDRCSRAEGTQSFIQETDLLSGIKLHRELQVFQGVRLVPLPNSEISKEVIGYLPGFPWNAFTDLAPSFFGKTLLVIDCPALSIFHRPAPDPTFPQGHPADDLPFSVAKHDLRLRNSKELFWFKQHYCQALSLICNSPVHITHGGRFLDEEKSFNPHHQSFSMFWPPTSLGTFAHAGTTEAGGDDIENASALYWRLVNLKPNDREKIQVGIGRWIKSKVLGNYVDKVIDLGIAFEALYLPGIKDELAFRLGVRAAWYLGKNEGHRKELLTKFGEIYKCRSNAVHDGQLGKAVKFGGKPVSISEFIEEAQDLCRKSIMKIIDDGGFPDWDRLILGANLDE